MRFSGAYGSSHEASSRAAELDAGYTAYDKQPLDQQDEWGDLASFRQGAGAS